MEYFPFLIVSCYHSTRNPHNCKEVILSKFVGNFPICFPERSHRKDLLFHYRHIVIYSGMRIIFSSTDKSFAQIIYLSCTFV